MSGDQDWPESLRTSSGWLKGGRSGKSEERKTTKSPQSLEKRGFYLLPPLIVANGHRFKHKNKYILILWPEQFALLIWHLKQRLT